MPPNNSTETKIKIKLVVIYSRVVIGLLKDGKSVCWKGGWTKKSFPKTKEGREKRVEEKVCWDSSFGGTKRRGFPYIPQYCPLQMRRYD